MSPASIILVVPHSSLAQKSGAILGICYSYAQHRTAPHRVPCSTARSFAGLATTWDHTASLRSARTHRQACKRWAGVHTLGALAHLVVKHANHLQATRDHDGNFGHVRLELLRPSSRWLVSAHSERGVFLWRAPRAHGTGTHTHAQRLQPRGCTGCACCSADGRSRPAHGGGAQHTSSISLRSCALLIVPILPCQMDASTRPPDASAAGPAPPAAAPGAGRRLGRCPRALSLRAHALTAQGQLMQSGRRGGSAAATCRPGMESAPEPPPACGTFWRYAIPPAGHRLTPSKPFPAAGAQENWFSRPCGP